MRLNGGRALAPLLFAAVRIGGHPLLPLPWRWGYGWPWPRLYQDPIGLRPQRISRLLLALAIGVLLGVLFPSPF